MDTENAFTAGAKACMTIILAATGITLWVKCGALAALIGMAIATPAIIVLSIVPSMAAGAACAAVAWLLKPWRPASPAAPPPRTTT